MSSDSTTNILIKLLVSRETVVMFWLGNNMQKCGTDKLYITDKLIRL